MRMRAISFKTPEEMAAYQLAREIKTALAVQKMSSEERAAWLSREWGKLQEAGNIFLLQGAAQRPLTGRSYPSMEAKNRFDENREIEEALSFAAIHR